MTDRASPPKHDQRRVIDTAEKRAHNLARLFLKDLGQLMTLELWREALRTGEIPASANNEMRKRLNVFARKLVRILNREKLLAEQIDFKGLAELGIADFVKVFELGQIGVLRDILRMMFEAGPTLENLKTLGQAAGLTARQAQAVERARRAALEAGLPMDKAAEVAAGVRDRLLDYRAKTIARTEAVRHAALIIQARGEELLGQGKIVTRQWVSARDENVDHGDPNGPCAQNDNGVRIGMFEPFPSGHHLPPAHPNCRCVIEIWVET